jgi:hypothetical protein
MVSHSLERQLRSSRRSEAERPFLCITAHPSRCETGILWEGLTRGVAFLCPFDRVDFVLLCGVAATGVILLMATL